jgi:phosphatidylethanolamine-binding protein (PEBP) family uncharacterized protein
MRRSVRAAPAAALLVGLSLSGCSSSGANATPAAAHPVRMQFKSTAIVRGALPARYTCDGTNISPPMEWGNVPSSTKELALLVVGFIPSSAGTGYDLSIEWAVAGVDPKLHRLAAGQLPPEAFLGEANGGRTRYSICPGKGTSRQYEFVLYAIPRAVQIPRGFVGMEVLNRIGAATAPTPATASGEFEVLYRRRS